MPYNRENLQAKQRHRVGQDRQPNDTEKNKNIATVSITPLSIMALNTVMLTAYAECRQLAYYADCRYAECYYADIERVNMHYQGTACTRSLDMVLNLAADLETVKT